MFPTSGRRRPATRLLRATGLRPLASAAVAIATVFVLPLAVVAAALSPLTPLPAGQPAVVERHLVPLSPEDEAKTIQLPDGYRLELVLSEPDIKEPMAIAFDGDGRMLVVEMRTYMQDIEGTGELEPRSRVSRHGSSRKDGRFDQHTVFADNLLVPRMVLPLQDEVLIGVTDTSDIMAWRDKDGDGTADEKRLFFAGGPRGGNMEHQPSGLVWSLDNWIYTTYNAYRLRWTPGGKTIQEPTAPNGGQWGLAQDDWGKLWFSNAGGERGIWNFQTHIAHGAVNVPSQWSEDWMAVWPAIGLGDVQGGPGRLRPDGTLNHFTATCGQEIFRGDRLPEELRGNVFLPEPVGRLVRRGIVEMKDGITTVRNPYPGSEFMRSTDANFRPVNMATGPDGCLYMVDAYRGIIQEGNWTKPDSFLRPQIQRWGLDKNVGRGRIWRLVHRDHKPGPQPAMLGETGAQLVAHLGHPNGWWRDTAQRLLVVRQDKSVVPALVTIVRSGKDPLGRVHALWTLEGLASAEAAVVRAALRDAHPRVRENAVRVSESLVKAGDASFAADILAMGKDANPGVVVQAIGSAKRLNLPAWPAWAVQVIAASKSAGVQQIGTALTTVPAAPGLAYSLSERAALKHGEAIYRELCFACHGIEGRGMTQEGAAPGATIGPALAKSRTVTGNREAMVAVLLHGLSGPVNGKAYDAQMVAMADNDDAWIADVASYVRNTFGNRASFIAADDVKVLRGRHASRTGPWTEDELASSMPWPLANAKDWRLSANTSAAGCTEATDGKRATRWHTGTSQRPGQWYQIELPAETKVAGLVLDAAASADDYPRGYKVELSGDGQAWGAPVATGKGTGPVTEISFPAAPARFIRITQTGSVDGLYWSIHEIGVLAVR